jgi:hypothetical protein
MKVIPPWGSGNQEVSYITAKVTKKSNQKFISKHFKNKIGQEIITVTRLVTSTKGIAKIWVKNRGYNPHWDMIYVPQQKSESGDKFGSAMPVCKVLDIISHTRTKNNFLFDKSLPPGAQVKATEEGKNMVEEKVPYQIGAPESPPKQDKFSKPHTDIKSRVSVEEKKIQSVVWRPGGCEKLEKAKFGAPEKPDIFSNSQIDIKSRISVEEKKNHSVEVKCEDKDLGKTAEDRDSSNGLKIENTKLAAVGWDAPQKVTKKVYISSSVHLIVTYRGVDYTYELCSGNMYVLVRVRIALMWCVHTCITPCYCGCGDWFACCTTTIYSGCIGMVLIPLPSKRAGIG